MKDPMLLASRSFIRSFERASPKLQRRISVQVVRLWENFAETPGSLFKDTDPVSYLKAYEPGLREIRFTSLQRGIATAKGGHLKLLATGGHGLIAEQKYTRTQLKRDLGSANRIYFHTFKEIATGRSSIHRPLSGATYLT